MARKREVLPPTTPLWVSAFLDHPVFSVLMTPDGEKVYQFTYKHKCSPHILKLDSIFLSGYYLLCLLSLLYLLFFPFWYRDTADMH